MTTAPSPLAGSEAATIFSVPGRLQSLASRSVSTMRCPSAASSRMLAHWRVVVAQVGEE